MPQPPAQEDVEFGTDEALAAQVAQINAEAGVPEGMGAPLPPEPEPEAAPAKKGGLFGKLMGRREKDQTPPPPADGGPPPLPGDAPFGAPQEGAPPPLPGDAGFGAPQDASFDAGFPEDAAQDPNLQDPNLADPALADPDLVAAAFGESPGQAKKARKPLPIVAIGWGILALIVLIVVGLFTFAPATTVSMLPGAARVYAMLGMPVGTQGLAFEGVRYGWTTNGNQTVLEVQGNVRNEGSATMTVPTVIIALRDENGEEISEWRTEVGAAELGAEEEAPFLLQIPSPPSNVRSLKVRFANAN